MILKYKFIILSFLFNTIIGGMYAQESVRIIYQVVPRVDSKNTVSLETEEMLIRAGQILSSFEFELLIRSNECIFKKTSEIVEDYSDIHMYRIALAFSAGDEIWYSKKGEPEKVIYKEDREGPKTLTLNEEVQWEISEETKFIGKYRVIKANTTRKKGGFTEKIEAWFAPELPYYFGPIGYNGLPGLILEMSKPKVVFMFKEIQKKAVEIKTPKESTRMTLEKYYEILEARVAGIKNGN